MENNRITPDNAFSYAFAAMKIKYADLDEILQMATPINKGDYINVFIDCESIFKQLTAMRGIDTKVAMNRNYATQILSNFINHIAFYKTFFVRNNYHANIYLYYTDFGSDYFYQFKYNEDYRGYYMEKYTSNPHFVDLMEGLRETVLPDLVKITEFIPNVYVISAHNIESALVPCIFAASDVTRKNLIISEDFYTSQYSLIPNFSSITRFCWNAIKKVMTSPFEIISHVTKKDIDEIKHDMDFLQYYSLYCSTLSVMGSKERSIESIYGYGPLTYRADFDNALKRGKVTLTNTSPEVLSNIFDDSEIKEEFLNNYACTCLYKMYGELTDAEKDSILIQKRPDRIDMNAIEELNRTRFIDNPINTIHLFEK